MFSCVLDVKRIKNYFLESMIPAQDERWRRGLGMQVERES
ncbi:uncharacterized protein METZ01_LOCUS335132 [marine metagenome]|uniref:Uncharacterized protein n=1 Tax=marine metagenome TaxID=408172 RepID=A0A382QBD9_9ZZZZ